MGATGLCSRAEALEHRTNSTSPPANSRILISRIHKPQHTYSKRVSRSRLRPPVPIRELHKRRHNAKDKHKKATKSMMKAKDKKPKMVQTTLNLAAHGVAPVPETCGECGFILTDASLESRLAHTKYHEDRGLPVKASGYKFRGAKCPKIIALYARGCKFEAIGVSKLNATKWKGLAEKALARVEVNISGRELNKVELWSEFEDRGGSAVPRFKVYLALKDSHIVSVVVAERINKARVVNMIPCDVTGNTNADDVDGEAMTEHKVEYTDRSVDVNMGIHYVWTHEDFRKQGFATALLDHARLGNFLAGLSLDFCKVAFTDLSEAGKKFAVRYLTKGSSVGKKWSYHEYDSLSTLEAARNLHLN